MRRFLGADVFLIVFALKGRGSAGADDPDCALANGEADQNEPLLH